jgi:hypothetical protein
VRQGIDRLAQQETMALEALQRAVVDALDELGRKQEDALASLPEAVLARVESRVRDLERVVLRQGEQLRALASEMPRGGDEPSPALEDERGGKR